jgi:predicted RecB family nuclease
MQLTPSDIYTHYRPSKCDLRTYLQAQGLVSAVASPYAEVLKRLGQRHERKHLESFSEVENLSEVHDTDELLEKTRAGVAGGLPIIYQPLLRATLRISGVDCEVSGRPDFLIKDDLGYRIRDSKMSRRITEKDHPEIILQMACYGWLFERVFQTPAYALEVHRGSGDVVPVIYNGPDAVIDALREIVLIRKLEAEPFSPVGVSKCGGCGFHDYCWPRAQEARSVALVIDVDQGLAITLHEMGVRTMDQLIERFDEETLTELKGLKGTKLVRVGSKAGAILRNAKALASGEELLLTKPNIPIAENYVMFDLEGLPPQLDELQKIYLWGMQVFGMNPSDYVASTAGFGVNGDREGWENFLANAARIFEIYGNVRFVHWASYEKTLLKLYVNRFGDDTGTAARVFENLLDLLQITEDSIVLPLPSYSLKIIEKHIGFERTQDEYGGNWSMAKYIGATETEDEATREQVMDAIRTYNREDLEATWAVLQWLKTRGANAEPVSN